jgi:transposase
MSQAKLSKISNNSAGYVITQQESSTPKRRTWTSKLKLQVVTEVEQLRSNGADVGSYLRKQGLFSSTVSLWKRQRNEGLLGAETKARGPKSKVTPEKLEIHRLQKELEKVTKKLQTAEKILDVQKKIVELFQPKED